MTENRIDRSYSHPLPASVADWQRKAQRHGSIIDQVEDVLLSIHDTHPRLHALLLAVNNDEAIEGSILADDYEVAGIIRDEAPQGSPLKHETKHAIKIALNRALGRWNESRLDRRRRNGQITSGPQAPEA